MVIKQLALKVKVTFDWDEHTCEPMLEEGGVRFSDLAACSVKLCAESQGANGWVELNSNRWVIRGGGCQAVETRTVGQCVRKSF